MHRGSEDDLICDMAQYYHILDYRSLPVSLTATLAAGLPEDSRSKRRITGQSISMNTALLALLVDSVRIVDWHLCGGKKKNKPESVFERLTKEPEKNEIVAFSDAAAFEEWHKNMMTK